MSGSGEADARRRLRTRRYGSHLRISLGPAETGPKARAQDKLVASLRHQRLLQGLAEGIAASLTTGFRAQLIESVNHLEAPRPYLSPQQREEEEAKVEELRKEADEAAITMATVNSESLRSLIEAERNKILRKQNRIIQTLAATTQIMPPEPYQEVEVTGLLDLLASITNGEEPNKALKKIALDLRPVRIGILTVWFEASLMLPTANDQQVQVLNIRFSAENLHRVTPRERLEALVDLCLKNAWPAQTVESGIPLVAASRKPTEVARALSHRLAPMVGSKAGSVLGGCQAPEVIAVISRHFDIGDPEVQVSADLEARIVDRYIHTGLPGANSWIEEPDHFPMTDLVRRLHQQGKADATQPLYRVPHWEHRGYLDRQGDQFIAQTCRCGSKDLALIPTPEPHGLVCLNCREDRSGLVIPPSWNIAVRDRTYWEAQGYDLTAPALPGLPTYHLSIQPI